MYEEGRRAFAIVSLGLGLALAWSLGLPAEASGSHLGEVNVEIAAGITEVDHICLLEMFGAPPCTMQAVPAAGTSHSLQMSGEGWFKVSQRGGKEPRAVGRPRVHGSFAHRCDPAAGDCDPDACPGGLCATGKWVAQWNESWDPGVTGVLDTGEGAGVPPSWRAGRWIAKVVLTPDGTRDKIRGRLTVDCYLPGPEPMTAIGSNGVVPMGGPLHLEGLILELPGITFATAASPDGRVGLVPTLFRITR